MGSSIVASVVARVFDAGLRAGLSAESLGEALGVRREDLTANARVSIDCLFDCFALCLRQTREPAFPLMVAEQVELEDYAVLGFALMTSAQMTEAFERLSRFGHLITDSGRWKLERARHARLEWVREGPRTLGHRTANECALAEVVGGLRQALGTKFAPVSVHFRHEAPTTMRAHERFFGAPLKWGSTFDGLEIDPGVLTQVPRAHNSAMSRFFGEMLERHAPERTSLSGQIRELLMYQLSSGAPSISEVARRLAMPERTLRRKLSEESTTYRDVLDDVRRAMSLELLDAGRNITDVAFVLGFSETSAFSRAFKRWHHASPLKHRAQRP